MNRQSQSRAQEVVMVASGNILIRFLAFRMSARRAAVTPSKETVMGKWTQISKQHDSYGKHDEDKKKKDEHKGHKDKGCK
jgi:hypothetical protein